MCDWRSDLGLIIVILSRAPAFSTHLCESSALVQCDMIIFVFRTRAQQEQRSNMFALLVSGIFNDFPGRKTECGIKKQKQKFFFSQAEE